MTRKQSLRVVIFIVCLSMIFSNAIYVKAANSTEQVPIYRLYNRNTSEHLYTKHIAERTKLLNDGWTDEGIGWYAPSKSDVPVYRVYNPNAKDHHFTTDFGEVSSLVKKGWRNEGIQFYSDENKTHAIYRQYNPNKKTGNHNFTLNKAEVSNLLGLGWRDEGIRWYACAPGKPAEKPSVPPTKVDVNITGDGGREVSNPGSFRYFYSNKSFDTLPSGYTTPHISFSSDVILDGNTDMYGMQFVIAGNDGTGSGQIGFDIGYQKGTSKDFGQGTIAVKTVNFPTGANSFGEQYYSVNTSAKVVNNQKFHIDAEYYKGDSGEYIVTKLNGTVVGCYKTALNPKGGDTYILHVDAIDRGKGKVKCDLTNIKVLKDGVDVTTSGRPSFNVLGTGAPVGTAIKMEAGGGKMTIHGAY